MCAYLAREEGFLGEVVAVLGPSTYSCSAVLCSDGLSCAAASRRSARGGGEGDGDLRERSKGGQKVFALSWTAGTVEPEPTLSACPPNMFQALQFWGMVSL